MAVLVEGRPRLLRGALDGAAAVVWAGLPGPEGGAAIAELLTGAFSPSGRLPISYPATDTNLGYGGQYWHAVTEQCNGPDTLTGAVTADTMDRFPHWGTINTGTQEPGGCFHQWAFGTGAGYTDFAYSALSLSTQGHGGQLHTTQLDTGVMVSVTVTNTGSSATASTPFAGLADHTVMLFVTDEVRSIVPEIKMLKHFERVSLAPGQSTTVSWTVDRKDLEFYGKNMAAGPIVEPGVFTVRVGTAPDCEAGCAGSADRTLPDGTCDGPAALVCAQFDVVA